MANNIDRSAVNLEELGTDFFTANNSNVLGKGKKGFTSGLKVKKGGSGPSKKVSKPTKTSGKFGGVKKSGKVAGSYKGSV